MNEFRTKSDMGIYLRGGVITDFEVICLRLTKRKDIISNLPSETLKAQEVNARTAIDLTVRFDIGCKRVRGHGTKKRGPDEV